MTKYLLGICTVVALGGFLFGYDTAVISGAIPFIQPYFNMDEITLGWAVSSVLIGCIIGVIFAGRLGDKFGRKPPLIVCSLLFATSAIGSAMAIDLTWFIIFRLLGGFAVGGASMLAPVYISETAPAAYRGRMVSLNQLTIVIGILVAFFSNYFLVNIGNDNWRWMLGLEAIPSLLFFVTLQFVPESPRWLILHGQEEKANLILTRINQTKDNELQISDIRAAQNDQNGWNLGILKQKKYLKWVLVGIIIAILQQFTGINVIMYYAPTIFKTAGFGADSALLQTAFIGIINVVFTLLAMRLIDNLGRKPLLIAGSFLMLFFLSITSLLFFTGNETSIWTLVCLLGFVASFSFSMGPGIWVILSELYPNSIRATATSLAIGALWVSAFIVSLSFPLMLSGWGGQYSFLFYAICNLISILFIWKWVPETKGKSLETLEKELYGPKQ